VEIGWKNDGVGCEEESGWDLMMVKQGMEVKDKAEEMDPFWLVGGNSQPSHSLR
jgi:hypothetical protein